MAKTHLGFRYARSWQKAARWTLSVAFVASLGTAAGSDPYRLVAGDRITIAHTGSETALDVTVDIDGQVRLPDVGGVQVAGASLDDARDRIEGSLIDNGLYVDPRVSVLLTEYAPIVVAGDVANPGRFEFIPGMTVATAMALSGGSQARGVSRLEVERAKAETEGQLNTLNLEIAAAALRVARLRALVEGQRTFELTPDLRARIPDPAVVALEDLAANEHRINDADWKKHDEFIAFWDQEIATIEAQAQLFADRMIVQAEVVEATGKDLANALALQERGLQTSSRLTLAEQRNADARSRALELETARMAAIRAAAEERRDRQRFLANRLEEKLAALQEYRVLLETLQLRYSRSLEHMSILGGGNLGALLAPEALGVDYTLSSSRSNRALTQPVDAETPLLPGDLLIVDVGSLANGTDG